jgi:long-chain acyl-CoA synthetase/crotonobetaine/carnitine-CoA ligase
MTTAQVQAEMLDFQRRMAAAKLQESLGDLVRDCAQREGVRVALRFFEDDLSLTYQDLDQAADRLASSLLQMGVRKGTHVAVMLPNVAAFPISWVALARIGSVMVPINTAYTADEISFVVNDAHVQFMIVDEAFLTAVCSMPRRPEMLADENIIVSGHPPQGMKSWTELKQAGAYPFVAPVPVTRADLLNIQYTSGTTGFPKGCMLSHDYWVVLAHSASLLPNSDAVREKKRRRVENILIWAPFFYMDPMWQFLMTLTLGGTAIVARKMSLSLFYNWLKDFEIQCCIFPEPALKRSSPDVADGQLSLQLVHIFGWREEARREIERRFNAIARESYGMTEVGSALMMPISAGEMVYERTCGLAAPLREVRIVDEEGHDVPDGGVGELWVAGRAILWGYYMRPEANAVSFRGKWFRTGDLFRRNPAGYYFIVGRIKDMIRRGGENIAAQEVEAVLRSLPAIEEAAVLPVPDPLRREEIKAYIKLRAGATAAECSPDDIFSHCAIHLAKFKIPRYVCYVDDFPRTPSRKIQKRVMIAEADDLRIGSYDREEGIWR